MDVRDRNLGEPDTGNLYEFNSSVIVLLRCGPKRQLLAGVGRGRLGSSRLRLWQSRLPGRSLLGPSGPRAGSDVGLGSSGVRFSGVNSEIRGIVNLDGGGLRHSGLRGIVDV